MLDRERDLHSLLTSKGGSFTDRGWLFYGDLRIPDLGLYKLPLIAEVDGDLDISRNYLTSLRGAPMKVGGDFCASYNRLTTLSHGPSRVGGVYFATHNMLTSLEGCPQEVGSDFDISNNPIECLRNKPEKVRGVFRFELYHSKEYRTPQVELQNCIRSHSFVRGRLEGYHSLVSTLKWIEMKTPEWYVAFEAVMQEIGRRGHPGEGETVDEGRHRAIREAAEILLISMNRGDE